MTSQSLLVACPNCSKEIVWDAANKFRPFCSERCKLVDLGKWANEEYRVEQKAEPEGFESSESA